MSDQQNSQLELDDSGGAEPSLLQGIRLNLPGAIDDAMAERRFAIGPGPAPLVDALKGKFAGLEVLRAAGQGGMGFVYQAWQTSPERLVALKLVCRNAGFEPADLHRFQREATILARLDHPAIAPCFYSDQIKDAAFPGGALAFMVMQWVEGRDLQSILAERRSKRLGGMPLEQALEITIQTGCAVSAAHQKGIVHRDLKPANLMLEGASDQLANYLSLPAQIRVKVLDFGLGVYCAPDGAPIPQTVVGGTPVYASPEQLDPQAGVDGRADIYSLGVIFYQLLTGELPLGSFPNASTIANVDEAVDSLLKRALNPTPERRQKTMAEFVAGLERLRDTRLLDTRHVTLLCLHGSPDDSAEQHLRHAAEIVHASPGTALVDGRGREGIWVQARTANAGAALGLRWLYKGVRADADGQEHWLHRVGMAAGDRLLEPLSPPEDLPGNPGADMAERLANLALPGQFLVAGRLFDQVRVDGLRDQVRMKASNGTDPVPTGSARFHLHGRFMWPQSTGTSPQAISELVGQICPAENWSSDPFRPPPNPAGGKASLDEDDDAFPGEQLAAGEPVPHCPGWTLREKLGQGGYGEVWLAQHPRETRLQAFKFCHDALRLDSFRRESQTLAALEAELPGEPGFSYLKGQQLERAPFSLRTEYCPLGNLQDWLESVGGAGAIPLAKRVELVSRVAVLVAAAHSLGIIHRDLKPSNILILAGAKDDPFSVRPRLADFGLSGRDERFVEKRPGAGLLPPTQSNLLSGTRIYRAPEVRTSTQSDVYALGVILFQLVADRFDLPPAEGWRSDIADELLREDIALAIQKDPAARPGASEFARRLEDLPGRAARQDAAAAQAAARLRLQKRLKVAMVCAGILVFISSVLGVAFFEERARALSAALSARETKGQLAAQKEKELLQEQLNSARGKMELAYLAGFSPANPSKYITFDSAVQDFIMKYDLQKTVHPEALTPATLEQMMTTLLGETGITQANSDISLDTQFSMAACGLDICLLGLVRAPGNRTFARNAVFFAGFGGNLLVKGRKSDPIDIRDFYARGRKPAEIMLDDPLISSDNLYSAMQIYRALARFEEKTSQPVLALADWRKCASITKRGRENTDTGEGLMKTFRETARLAYTAIRRLEGSQTLANP